MIKVKAKIVVHPNNRSRLKKKKKPFEEQTIIAELSKDVSYLYSYFFFKKYGVKIEPPPFGSHVTIHNGRESYKIDKETSEYLKSINNTYIDVYLDVEAIYFHWKFIAIPVRSKNITDIRKRLQISEEFLHTTVGKIKENSQEDLFKLSRIILF